MRGVLQILLGKQEKVVNRMINGIVFSIQRNFVGAIPLKEGCRFATFATTVVQYNSSGTVSRVNRASVF